MSIVSRTFQALGGPWAARFATGSGGPDGPSIPMQALAHDPETLVSTEHPLPGRDVDRAQLVAAITDALAGKATDTGLAAVVTRLGQSLAVTGPVTNAQLTAQGLATDAGLAAIVARLGQAMAVTGPLTNAQLTGQGLASQATQALILTALTNLAGGDASVPVKYADQGGYPAGATPLNASSGNQANTAAVATLAKGAGQTTYLTGFEITGAGATAAGIVLATVTGLVGGPRTLVVAVPAGATTGLTRVAASFDPPLPALTPNADIVVTLPPLGAGNTNAAVNAQGFRA